MSLGYWQCQREVIMINTSSPLALLLFISGFEGVSNTITRQRLLGYVFLHFTSSPLGKMVKMFCQISQNCEEVFRWSFLYGQDGHPTVFWNKQKGGFRWNLAPLDPSKWPTTGGVGDKHPHDSDHAKCPRVINPCEQDFDSHQKLILLKIKSNCVM